MTTLVLDLTPALAKRVAAASQMTQPPLCHEYFAVKAVQLLCDSMLGKRIGRPVGYRPSKFSAAGQQRRQREAIAKQRARRQRVVKRITARRRA